MTTLPATETSYVDAPEVAPRKLARKATGVDRVFELSASAIGATVLLITSGIGAFLAWQSDTAPRSAPSPTCAPPTRSAS